MSIKYEVREVFIHEMFEDSRSQVNPDEVLATFNSYWKAVIYRWWHQFGWESLTYATWRVDIKKISDNQDEV